MPHRLLSNHPMLLGLGYGLLLQGLWPTEDAYWILSYGLRFAVLMLTPIRFWGWLIVGELVSALAMEWRHGLPVGWLGFLLGDLPAPLLVVGCVWLIRRFAPKASLRNPTDGSLLLLCSMAVACASSCLDVVKVIAIYGHGHLDYAMMAQLLGQSMLSNYVSILLVLPCMVMVFEAWPSRNGLHRLGRDGLVVMLPCLLPLFVLSTHPMPQPIFARILSLAPVLYFAFRHGWRGAGLSMLALNLVLHLFDKMGWPVEPSDSAYLFLAVTGSGALLLGSASDALRRINGQIAQQNIYLGAVNQRLDLLAQQLQEAARGNLQSDEDQRRHLAIELHDELGQNLTAIQTHVKLARTRLHEAGLDDIGASINQILAHMRRTLHRMLDDLRPAVLDEFGLFRALDEGPIRDLLRAAGIAYHTKLHGDPRQLDEETRTALYRLVQESATNTVKHAQATEFRLRLRIGRRRQATFALLNIRDNGVGIHNSLAIVSGGRGLRGMRDRVTSLGGLFRIKPTAQGVQLRALLRCGGSGPLRSDLGTTSKGLGNIPISRK